MKMRKFKHAVSFWGTVFGCLGASLLMLGFSPSASAGEYPGVSFTLQGCKSQAGYNPDATPPDLICDFDGYTTGNLGKLWNELDLVPYRITTDAGNSAPATQTFTVAVALDNMDQGHPGYDVLSIPRLNSDLSNASCSEPVVGSEILLIPGIGGVAETRYRMVTITQQKNTKCVYDYYGRLAVGSHLYPGSSLHANLLDKDLTTGGVGAKEVSIPVREIEPQDLGKVMAATRYVDHTWSLNKTPDVANVDIGDVCALGEPPYDKEVTIRVDWERVATDPAGLTIMTKVYATNPSMRTILTRVSDVIYSGNVALDTWGNGLGVYVPPNSKDFLVLEHTVNGVDPNATDLNDIATATYIDEVTNVPVTGNTTARASVDKPDSIEVNGTATITDSEYITFGATDLDFSVAKPLIGTFTDGYIAGVFTDGPVNWNSGTQTTTGLVDFLKTVRLNSKTVVTNGVIYDLATLTTSRGLVKTDDLFINITSTANVTLTLQKTIPAGYVEPDDWVDVTFHVYRNGEWLQDAKVTFYPGDTEKSIDLRSLTPGTYTATETCNYFDNKVEKSSCPNLGVVSTISTADLNLPNCSGTIAIENNYPAGLSPSVYVQKTTLAQPDQLASGDPWVFHLVCDNGIDETTQVNANQLEPAVFAATFDPDTITNCTMSETMSDPQKAEWELTSVIMSKELPALAKAAAVEPPVCTFVVDLSSPDMPDAGKVITCTFTNKHFGYAKLEKTVSGAEPTQDAFNFELRTGASESSSGELVESGVANSTNQGSVSFTSKLRWDTTYNFCEQLKEGWTTDFADNYTTYTPDSETGWICTDFTVQPGETVTFTIDNVPPGYAKLVKTVSGAAPTQDAFNFQLRTGASTTLVGTLVESGVAQPSNGGVVNFISNLTPGVVYNFCEQLMAGWMTTLGPPQYPLAYVPDGDNSWVCTDFTVQPDQTVTFTIDNSPPPGGDARTIGYWKNWSSCAKSHGNQKPVLDQTLALAPIWIGNINLADTDLDPDVASSCLNAVNLLSKNTLKGVNAASDSAYQLAAQLLAAKLNIQAGADSCPEAETAIAQGQNILDGTPPSYAISFTGLVTAKKRPSEFETEANRLAGILDSYNNNILCP